jgi:hypothetical protein
MTRSYHPLPRPRFAARVWLILIGLVLVAACGGSAATTPSQTEAVQPVASNGDAGGPPTAEASVAPSAAEPAAAGGGGGVADVCALVTNDELASVFGQATTTEVFVGPPDTCQVGTTDGAGLAAFVLARGMGGVSASFVYDSFASSPTATEIGGIGEKAAYDSSQGALVVLKNDAVLTVSVFDDGSGSTDEASRLDQMKQIGSAAAGRM